MFQGGLTCHSGISTQGFQWPTANELGKCFSPSLMETEAARQAVFGWAGWWWACCHQSRQLVWGFPSDISEHDSF